jgi:peptide/nickel transport system substrate-binding protein
MHPRTGLALGLALTLLSGTASAESVLRTVMHADLKSIDPIWTTATISRYHGHMVYETLFAIDGQNLPQPQMVREHALSPDRLTYTFVLRDGLRFHDGEPVTAEDVVASIRRWAARDAAGQMMMRFTKDIAAADAKTVRMTLSEPFGLVVDALAQPTSTPAFIMPKRVAATDPNTQIDSPIGSGPFRMARDQWVPGSRTVYLKNADYVPRSEPVAGTAGGRVAKVDRVEWMVLPDAQTTTAALSRGEIDYYEGIAADFIPVLRSTPGVKVEMLSPLGSAGIMRLNHLHPPFDNPAIRRAMLHLVNQKEILSAAIGDPTRYTVCGAILICGSPMGSEAGAEAMLADVPESERIARAKKALADAGYKGEPIILLHSADHNVFHPVALVLESWLRKGGVNVQLATSDWGTVTTRRNRKEVGPSGWHIFLTSGGGFSAANPAFHIPMSAACDKAWFGWPCDDVMEKLRVDWVKASSLEARKEIATTIQRRSMEIVQYIPFGQWVSPVAFRSNVSGILAVPETQVFWNVAKM